MNAFIVDFWKKSRRFLFSNAFTVRYSLFSRRHTCEGDDVIDDFLNSNVFHAIRDSYFTSFERPFNYISNQINNFNEPPV